MREIITTEICESQRDESHGKKFFQSSANLPNIGILYPWSCRIDDKILSTDKSRENACHAESNRILERSVFSLFLSWEDGAMIAKMLHCLTIIRYFLFLLCTNSKHFKL